MNMKLNTMPSEIMMNNVDDDSFSVGGKCKKQLDIDGFEYGLERLINEMNSQTNVFVIGLNSQMTKVVTIMNATMVEMVTALNAVKEKKE